MQEQSLYQGTFGGGASVTMLHPLAAVALVAAIVCMLFLPRKHVVAPVLLGMFLLPFGQQLYICGVHLYTPRILIMIGLGLLFWTKHKTKQRLFADGWNDLDKIFLCWAVVRALAVTFYYWGNTAALINQTAFLLDTLGGYFVFRFLIRDFDDIVFSAKVFAVIVGVLGVTMMNEVLRDQNIFGYFGTVPILPAIREGRIRAQGTFEHAILAGSFAAALLPFFLWLWRCKESKSFAALGVMGSTAMVICSASTTPLLMYLAVIVGVCMWPLRGYMRVMRWALVFGLILCHLMMKAPVWYLIGHVDLVAGNSGAHRAELINSFIQHFSDWWFLGTNKAVTWGIGMDDLCEQWIQEGETGGLATFILFILLITRSFSRIGRMLKRVPLGSRKEWLLWLVGTALFSHCVGYFGISYFDQTKYAWYAFLGMITVVTTSGLYAAKTAKRAADEPQIAERDEEAIPMPALGAAALVDGQGC